MRSFITHIFTKPRTSCKITIMPFLTYHALDLYIRIFVSFLKHSHHRYFIDFRHIICISYLQDNFLINIAIMLGQISADFNGLHTLKFYTFNACRSIKVNVSRRYPFIPFIEILVLQNINILCITFSVINESHVYLYGNQLLKFQYHLVFLDSHLHTILMVDFLCFLIFQDMNYLNILLLYSICPSFLIL